MVRIRWSGKGCLVSRDKKGKERKTWWGGEETGKRIVDRAGYERGRREDIGEDVGERREKIVSSLLIENSSALAILIKGWKFSARSIG